MTDEKLVTPAEKLQEQQRAAAREATATVRAHPADELPPGGGYIVDGRKVDADGQQVKAKDKS